MNDCTTEIPFATYTQYTCMHTYLHTHIHTYIHAYILTYTHTYIHMQTCMHTYVHTCIHTYTYIHNTYIHTIVKTLFFFWSWIARKVCHIYREDIAENLIFGGVVLIPTHSSLFHLFFLFSFFSFKILFLSVLSSMVCISLQ